MITWLSNLRHQRLTLRAAWLWSVGLFELAIVATAAYFLGGWISVTAAVAAALLCLSGATGALVASHMLRGPQYALPALLIGMALRLGMPLGPALVCQLTAAPLAIEGGLLYYLLVFYPVTLAVETTLSLPPRRQLALAQDLAATPTES